MKQINLDKRNIENDTTKIENETYLGMHLLGGESLDFSDSSGCSLLKSNSLKSLMHIQCVISGSILKLLLSSFFSTGHPIKF